ncbi:MULTISPECIES: hypothetical protein [Alphaproteobacteria]|uniref:hypothetical protein n=1 Tax=Alphaproteobacteria TaxID=28211 RepID=UPI003266A0AB
MAQSAIAKGSHAKPFTINLDHDIASKAYKSPKGAVGYVAHRLNRHLTKDGHIFPAWFALEISKSNVLHLHGCIITQTDEDLSVIKAAFRRVSGPFASDPKMVAGRFAVRIAKHDDAKCFQGSFGALGWGRYCLKSVIKTEKAIGCPPISMNHHMTNIARDYWGDIVSDANRTHGNRLSASDHGETSDEFKLAG